MSRTVTGVVRAPLLGDGRRRRRGGGGQMAPGRTLDGPYGTGPGREGQRPPRAPCPACSLRGGGTGAAGPDALGGEGGRVQRGRPGSGRGVRCGGWAVCGS